MSTPGKPAGASEAAPIEHAKVTVVLTGLMVMECVPEHMRSDNSSEFVAKDLRKWLTNTGAKTLYIEPGSS